MKKWDFGMKNKIDAEKELLMARNVELLNEQERQKKQIDILWNAIVSIRSKAIREFEKEITERCDVALARFQEYQGSDRS